MRKIHRPCIICDTRHNPAKMCPGFEGVESPEETGVYSCPCGNDRHFVGIDHHGYPGADCECGAYDGDEYKECTCTTSLTQHFYVLETEPDGKAADIHYDAHDGTTDSEIGSYNVIQCGECDTTIWADEPVVV